MNASFTLAGGSDMPKLETAIWTNVQGKAYDSFMVAAAPATVMTGKADLPVFLNSGISDRRGQAIAPCLPRRSLPVDSHPTGSIPADLDPANQLRLCNVAV